jgi:peptidylprolyl isomerase
MEAVDAIVRGEPPQNPTYIVQASIAADGKAPPPPPAAAADEAPVTLEMLNGAAGK